MATFDLGYEPSEYQSHRPGYNGTSLQDFFAIFPDDDACLEHLVRVRFGGDPTCPRCGRNGRWRRHAWQKHYFHPCGGTVSPMSGIFCSRSHIPLQLWFYALLHFANSPESMSNSFLARQLGISETSAFRVSHRIRYHLAAIDEDKVLGSDNSLVIVRLMKVLRIVNKRANSQNSAMILLLSDNRRVVSIVTYKPRLSFLRPVLTQKCCANARFVTDCYWTFRALSNYGNTLPVADFVPEIHHSDVRSKNLIHGFMQYFFLSFANQFHSVGIENSWFYLKEYEFRYNRRAASRSTYWDMVRSFPVLDGSAMQRLKKSNFVYREKP